MAKEELQPVYAKLNDEIVTLMNAYVSDSQMCKLEETNTKKRLLEKAIFEYIKNNPLHIPKMQE